MFKKLKHIDKHWDKFQSIIKNIPRYETNKQINEICEKYNLNDKEKENFKNLEIILRYPSVYNQKHCFDKFLERYKQNRNIEKFIIAKLEQSGGTFEICLYSYFTCRIYNNICVVCLMNFKNQKEQLQERYQLFNKYISKNNLVPLKIKYIRDFKKSDAINIDKDTDIIVCLYNSSSMKITFDKVCSLAYMTDRNISFAYDEIDIPESVAEKTKLKKIHKEILQYHPSKIRSVFGVSATTLGDIPGGFLQPKISDIIFKPPSETWTGIGHPSVELNIIDIELRDNITAVISNISRRAISKDGRFIGNLYIDVRNNYQEECAIELSTRFKDLVIFVYNGSTSSSGGKFTIFNSPLLETQRYDTAKGEYNLSKCFEHITKCMELSEKQNKFIFINHNMVLRGISIKGNGLCITDEIIFKMDGDIASSSQKYQRIAGLDLAPRRVYGLEIILRDIMQYQIHQAEIYSKCEIKSKESPDIYLDEYINSLNISAHYNQPLSRNPKTKVIKTRGIVPISFNITRYIDIISSRTDLIPIIKKNIQNGIIDSNINKWKRVIKYIENNQVNSNHSMIMDTQKQSIFDKHWILHYNNMGQNRGSCFSSGSDEHSKNSKCYIGIMKNKEIIGYGECMVVFTDKTKNSFIKI